MIIWTSAKVENFSHNSEKFPTVKVAVIGDALVGKTSITQKGSSDTFEDITERTIGVEYYRFYVKNRSSNVYLFEFCDTAGQERYSAMLPAYIRGVNMILIVYDVTNRVSFEHVEKWVTMAREHNEKAKIILVANKIDLLTIAESKGKSVIHYHEGHEKHLTLKMDGFKDVSARGDNFKDLMLFIGDLADGLSFEKKKMGLNLNPPLTDTYVEENQCSC